MDLNLIKPSVTKNCFCDNSGKLNMEWKLNHINKDFTVFLGSDKSIRIILKKKKKLWENCVTTKYLVVRIEL